MLGSTWNAKRFAGKPMRQPAYNFENVPKAQRNLGSSTVERVEQREHFVDVMGELVLLCNQAMKRAGANSPSKKSSKPLSLEYIADRLDVDDPIWGYVVRDKSTRAMQGFITCTTFTNWQKTFRWDSMHDSAFAYDPPALARQVMSGERVVDHDGSLAAALQSCVKCGDMWNEGIVSPRIAEISLLGGLGCGKALLSLVLEELESLPPSPSRNYDYVVLQATENSVSFYESMGFVRVGCVTEDDKFEEKQRKAQCSDTETDESSLHAADPVESSSSSSGSDGAGKGEGEEQSEIVTSPVIEYTVIEPGETPTEIADSLNVDVWDIVFLNHFLHKDITPRSRLMKDTKLYVPSSEAKAMATTRVEHADDLKTATVFPAWYVAAENETPKMIAKKFKVNSGELVAANRGRLPDLQGVSRLKEGTRIKVTHFDVHDDKFVPYCHWSFPDDTFEHADPSYMMARKLNRSPRTKRSSVQVENYKPPPASLYAVPVEEPLDVMAPQTPPPKPKRPANPYMLYTSRVRRSVTDSMKGAATSKVIRQIASMWKELPAEEKAKFTAEHQAAKVKYKTTKEKYDKQMEEYYRKNPTIRHQGDTSNLFNKVVRLQEHPATEVHSEFDYYYVLTYIPDLQWTHLAPMRRVGYWEKSGRPVWMLVDEKLGKEVDISSSFCIPVASNALKRTVDADRERWDIYESGPGLKPAPAAERETSGGDRAVAPPASRSATKPLGGALIKRKYAEMDPSIFSPNVLKRPQGESPRFQGVHRELPSRRVAPVSFADFPSPVPEKPSRVTIQTPPTSDMPQKRKRGRPRKMKCPIETARDFTSSSLPTSMKSGVLLFDEKGDVIPAGRGRPRKNPIPSSLNQAAPAKRGPGRPRKNETVLPKKRGRPRKDATDEQEPPKKRGRGRPPKNEATKKRGRAFKDEIASLEPPKKRGRGRPRKNPSLKVAEPKKRGRGRPPKNASPKTVAANEVEPVKSGRSPRKIASTSPTKRGPGRPRKNESLTPKRGPGRPRKDESLTPKRGPGRPKKGESLTPKRGPGRPRKDENLTPKRGPGRPRKNENLTPKRGPERPAKVVSCPKKTDVPVLTGVASRNVRSRKTPNYFRPNTADETTRPPEKGASVTSQQGSIQSQSRGGWTGSPRLRQLPNRKAESMIDESAIAARRAHAKADPSSPLLVGRRITRGIS